MPNTVETWLKGFSHLLVCSLILDTEEIFSTVSSSYNTFEDFHCLFSVYSSATVAAHGPWDADKINLISISLEGNKATNIQLNLHAKCSF